MRVIMLLTFGEFREHKGQVLKNRFFPTLRNPIFQDLTPICLREFCVTPMILCVSIRSRMPILFTLQPVPAHIHIQLC